MRNIVEGQNQNTLLHSYQLGRSIVEEQNQNTLLHILPTGEKHRERTESEYTIAWAISWRETKWKDKIRIHYYTGYQLVRNIVEGQNRNTLLHRLSAGEKHSGRTESEYTIAQAINGSEA